MRRQAKTTENKQRQQKTNKDNRKQTKTTENKQKRQQYERV
jgi:hypothetical protein